MDIAIEKVRRASRSLVKELGHVDADINKQLCLLKPWFQITVSDTLTSEMQEDK